MYEYPFGGNQQLNLDWFLEEFKNLVAAWEAEKAGIDGALDDEIARAEEALADVFAARDAAAASATAAAGSASSAGTSATAAGNSATAAAASATLANNKATAAGLSEANAAQSASNASASETTASNAATAAAASATQAGNSATAAAASAASIEGDVDAAAASATAAAGSATAAGQSATDAAASAAAAQAIASVNDSFPSRITPLSKAVTRTQGIAKVANGFIELVFGTGSSSSLQDVYTQQTLPAGTYKLVVDLLELPEFTETQRLGYIAVRKNGTDYTPRLDIFKDTPIQKHEFIFTLLEETTIDVLTIVSLANTGTLKSIKAFAYIDLASPTTALGLTLSN